MKKKKGIWHICYIKKYDLKTEEGRKSFFHYTNLCPRWNGDCDHTNDSFYEALKPIAEAVDISINGN